MACKDLPESSLALYMTTEMCTALAIHATLWLSQGYGGSCFEASRDFAELFLIAQLADHLCRPERIDGF